jgi:hypothetical protein
MPERLYETLIVSLDRYEINESLRYSNLISGKCASVQCQSIMHDSENHFTSNIDRVGRVGCVKAVVICNLQLIPSSAGSVATLC